jgi:ankyrin repeat protein
MLRWQRAQFFDKADRDGVTPLMLAASHGWIDSVRALVEGGASLDAHDKDGRIAVDYALREGQVETEIYLRQVRKKFAN